MKLDDPEQKFETPGACYIPVTVDPDDLDECSVVENITLCADSKTGTPNQTVGGVMKVFCICFYLL